MLLRSCHTAFENALPFLECHMRRIKHRDRYLFFVNENGASSAPCLIGEILRVAKLDASHVIGYTSG